MLSRPRYPQAETLAELERNFAEINGRIQTACRRVGRDAASVRLLPVTKTVDARRIRMAHALGYARFGENKVQEAWGKWQEMQDLPLDWVVIGHLQTNKIKYVAKFAAEFQALDSLRVAEQLDARLASEGRTLDVLVQVNTSGEASEYGLTPEAAEGFMHALAPFSRLKVKGLMTLALLSQESAEVRGCFVLLRSLREQLQRSLPDGMSMDELSMGMSGDFEAAIEEGATTVRIGQALFGARNLPDSHYWPEGGV